MKRAEVLREFYKFLILLRQTAYFPQIGCSVSRLVTASSFPRIWRVMTLIRQSVLLMFNYNTKYSSHTHSHRYNNCHSFQFLIEVANVLRKSPGDVKTTDHRMKEMSSIITGCYFNYYCTIFSCVINLFSLVKFFIACILIIFFAFWTLLFSLDYQKQINV